MKFKKDGKVYNTPEDMYTEICKHSKCNSCLLCRGDGGCYKYAIAYPLETAHQFGFETINDTPNIAEVVEKCGEDVKPDPVERPEYYQTGGIECIDAMTAAFGDETVKDFCLCNAFKYLWRHRQKNGVEDLKKARWYLNRLIEEMEVEE